jgi:hypothetical protein
MSSELSRNSATEVLKNIDQAMSDCATNLANLQKVSAEQAEALKALTAKLQDKNLHDAGLDLNTLTESFSAALEPMKEVGRLVPTIDQLSEAVSEHINREDRVDPDELLTSLAQQLADNAIDPWTFKSAYKAIFPSKSSADLLRGLVELLGTQRLSGTLFRAAYDAVQVGEGPGGLASQFGAGAEITPGSEQLRSDLANKEKELEQLLADKDVELQAVQEQMTARYEEFNSRYAEINKRLNSREQEYSTLLAEKETALTEKESELVMLRRQMEELRSQTHEIVSDLQKQSVAQTSLPVQKSSPIQQSSPTQAKPHVKTGHAEQSIAEQLVAEQSVAEQPVVSKPSVSSGFFDTAERPTSFYADAAIANNAAQGVQGNINAAATVEDTIVATPAPQTALATNTLRPTAPAAGMLTPGAGRHGTGVRAQVLEVIVRQALAGAPWREMCAGPMQVNNITPEEVEAEVKKRRS